MFRELNDNALLGVKYRASQLDGDVFVHLVEIEQSGANSIADLVGVFSERHSRAMPRGANPQHGSDHRQFRHVLPTSCT